MREFSAPLAGGEAILLRSSQGCASLALGYFHCLPREAKLLDDFMCNSHRAVWLGWQFILERTEDSSQQIVSVCAVRQSLTRF
jgi:hypothetical protein